MQEDVGQQRRDHASLRRAPVSTDLVALGIDSRRFQPSLDVEENPRTGGVFPHRVHHQKVIDVVEKPFDVQIEHPVVPPATLPGLPDCVQGGLPGAIVIGIVVEFRFHYRLQVELRHHLGHAIRYRGHGQR
jgi:hypothetical protein